MQNIEIKYKELLEVAKAARDKSYCPYSHFAVGAALLCEDGKVYTGANIENSSYTPTVCAERVAIFRAVHDGRRDFIAIAIAGGRDTEPSKSPVAPCGVCRQVMTEFAGSDFKIILDGGDAPVVYTLGELMPLRFDKTNLSEV